MDLTVSGYKLEQYESVEYVKTVHPNTARDMVARNITGRATYSRGGKLYWCYIDENGVIKMHRV